MQIEGRTFVITGTASGLGYGVAAFFARERGCKIIALDIDSRGLERLVDAVASPDILVVETDISDRVSVREAIEKGVERFGSIDVCLNFAGVVSPIRIFDPKTEEVDLPGFELAVSVNLVGTFNVMAHCAVKMKDNHPTADGERGVVVNISSAAAFDGQVGQSAYASSKAGVVGLSLPSARELARYGIRVNCIAPGAFDTPMLQSVPDSVVERIRKTIQFPRRMGSVSEIARLCDHICTNPYINGECMRLDGAMRMPPH